MLVGRRGYAFTPDWKLVRDDRNPDVVTEFATVPPDYYVDDAFEEGPEQDFDISLQLKLKGYDLKVVGDTVPRTEVDINTNKLLWKWGAYFDWRFRLAKPGYLNNLQFDEHLVVDSPYDVADGYGNMGINLVHTLLTSGIQVHTSNNWGKQNKLEDAPEYIQELVKHGFGKHTFGVRLSQPDSTRMCQSSYKINWSMWEFPVMPDHWVSGASSADLCLVPCGWNKQLWLEAGVTSPIVVMPLGFNPTNYWPGEKKHGKVFRFYTDGSILGGNNLIEQWLKLYGDREDLELVLKFPYPTQEKSRANLRVIDKRVTVDKMRELFWEADCYLYPSQAEGFGLFPIEAMACGLPVVATRLETMFSFINPDIAYPVPVKSIDWFHYPDMEYFFDVVKEIANGKWDYVGDKGERAAEHVFEHWKWQDSVTKLIGVLRG